MRGSPFRLVEKLGKQKEVSSPFCAAKPPKTGGPRNPGTEFYITDYQHPSEDRRERGHGRSARAWARIQCFDRPISPHPNLVTAEGLARIETEVARLQQEQAAAHAADDRAALARVARDLRYWTARRASAQIVPAPNDHSEVHFGATVTIVRDDGRRQTFRIVGEDEADPAHGTVSHVSPLARALFGRRVGDTAMVAKSQAEIVEIA
jgi:transcription elongation GreA/GreB family factor